MVDETNDMLETFKMLSKVLDRKQYDKITMVISQLFMGHRFDFEECDVASVRAEAFKIFRNVQKDIAAQIYREFDPESDVFGFSEHYRCTQMHEDPELKAKFFKFLLNVTKAPESLSKKDNVLDNMQVSEWLEEEAIKEAQDQDFFEAPFAILDNNEVITVLKGGKKVEKKGQKDDE